MRPIEILDKLYFIERGYLNANHFVYVSGEPVLIDTAYVGDLNKTVHMIASLGVEPNQIRLIVNTHCHCDHIGANRFIQQLSGCDIAVHKIGKHFIDTRDDWSTWWRYYNQQAEFFICSHELNDGDSIHIGPHEFEVIHTPGHASDGIVLYHKKNRILISSDTLWENDVAVMTVRVEGSAALFRMMESFDKIELLDVGIVYPGHGQPFADFKAALSTARKKIKSLIENRELIGLDILKKITVYTLLMRKSIPENEFFALLMDTIWFRETVDHYFNGEYELKYNEILQNFIDRGIIKCRDGKFVTVVKP
ncbi:MAG: MBL fold metallo-hydrolase [Desulfobacterales bacterium]|nr:MAG: MBL fold metallo-hydrolase [Desulfobacterales bacterium]